MERAALIVRRFDALNLDLRLYATTGGSLGVEAPGAMIRLESTLASLSGYGETPDEAVHALWQAIEDMDTGREVVRVERDDNRLQYYRWNGAAWKEIAASDLGYPERKTEAA